MGDSRVATQDWLFSLNYDRARIPKYFLKGV